MRIAGKKIDPRAYATMRALALRTALLLILWWTFAEGRMTLWWFGILVCIAAAGTSIWLNTPGRSLRLPGLIRFVPFFLLESLRGAVDVARRAARPSMNLQPRFIDYRMQLPQGAPRLWMTCLVSLLPGTVACRLHGNHLRIHVLDRSMDVEPIIERLEQHLARLFP